MSRELKIVAELLKAIEDKKVTVIKSYRMKLGRIEGFLIENEEHGVEVFVYKFKRKFLKMINTWANKYITIRFNDKVSEEILVSHKQNHPLKNIIKSFAIFTIFEQKHINFLYELKEMKI